MDIRQHYIKNTIETLQLPVPPNSFKIKCGKNSNSVTLLGFGEINDSGTPTLRTWSISSFFPNQDYTFVQGTRKSNPYDYASIIERLKDENIICYYAVTETNIYIPCTIEGFEYGEQDGSGDVYYTIDFKEHKAISLATLTNLTPVDNVTYLKADGTVDRTKNNIVIVREGDTLVNIALRCYGDSSKVTYIMIKNGLANVNDIRTGMVLKI